MNFRPNISLLWADQALPEDIGDADVFVPSNPNYPEQQPDQYNIGWTVTPSAVVKQPHQWINSFYHATDMQLKEIAEKNFGWDAGVTYAAGAIVLHETKRYVATAENINLVPGVDPVWSESLYGNLTKAQGETKNTDFMNSMKSHTGNKSNPHAVTAAQMGGYTQAEIDTKINTEQSDLNAHKALTDPHQLTPEQAGTIPSTGGTFTGEVNILEWRQREVNFKRSTDWFFMANSNNNLGINVKTRHPNKDNIEMLTTRTWGGIHRRNFYKFVAPVPDLHMPLTCNVHAYSASGAQVVFSSVGGAVYTDKSGVEHTTVAGEPAFNEDGLVTGGLDCTISVSNPGSLFGPQPDQPELGGDGNISEYMGEDNDGAYFGANGTVFALIDNVPTVYQGELTHTDLLMYFGTVTEYTSVKDLKIWNRILTDYELAGLGF